MGIHKKSKVCFKRESTFRNVREIQIKIDVRSTLFTQAHSKPVVFTIKEQNLLPSAQSRNSLLEVIGVWVQGWRFYKLTYLNIGLNFCFKTYLLDYYKVYS